MAQRESNRGRCCHPCRFKYAVMEETRPGQYFPIAEDDRGAYIFNSRDLCMLDHIPRMAEAGISALKIEGRMKSIHYVATTVKVYREALDAFHADPTGFKPRPGWMEELFKVSHRGYCSGFSLQDPSQVAANVEDLRCAGALFAGKVIGPDETGRVCLEVRNRLTPGLVQVRHEPLRVSPGFPGGFLCAAHRRSARAASFCSEAPSSSFLFRFIDDGQCPGRFWRALV